MPEHISDSEWAERILNKIRSGKAKPYTITGMDEGCHDAPIIGKPTDQPTPERCPWCGNAIRDELRRLRCDFDMLELAQKATYSELRRLERERDVLAERLIEAEELIHDEDGTLRWSGSGDKIDGSDESVDLPPDPHHSGP